MADDLRRLAEDAERAEVAVYDTPRGAIRSQRWLVRERAWKEYEDAASPGAILALYASLDAQAARIAALEAAGKVVVDTWGRFDDPHTRCTEDPCLFCLTVAALARALEGTA